MTITSVSVIVALVVGGIETLGLMAGHFDVQGPFWTIVIELNANFGAIGYAIVGLLSASWLISFVIYQVNGSVGFDFHSRYQKLNDRLKQIAIAAMGRQDQCASSDLREIQNLLNKKLFDVRVD